MAERIKLRIAASKAGASLALAALIAGITSTGEAAARPVRASAARSASFLKLGGIHGNVRESFLKLDDALGALEHKLARSYYSSSKLNSTFLKIKSAESQFLKIDTANASFLKIDDASTTFLKIDDANTSFLKIDGTAQNANEFGGASTESFSRSASGTATLAPGETNKPLLASPDDAIRVEVNDQIGGGLSVTITNHTASALPAVQDQGGGASTADIAAQSTRTIGLTSTTAQLHVQFLPVPGLFGAAHAEAATLIVSVEPNSQQNPEFVGQLLAGSL